MSATCSDNTAMRSIVCVCPEGSDFSTIYNAEGRCISSSNTPGPTPFGFNSGDDALVDDLNAEKSFNATFDLADSAEVFSF